MSISNTLSIDGDLILGGNVFSSNFQFENIHVDGYIVVDGNAFFNGDVSGCNAVFENIGTCNDLVVEGDITCKGTINCCSIRFEPYEHCCNIMEIARSNLIEFTQLDYGLVVPGAYFTPHENVFFKPTYFLEPVFLTSNAFNINPCVDFDLFARSNLYVGERLYGPSENCNLVIGSSAVFENHSHFHSNVYFHDFIYGKDKSNDINIGNDTNFHSNVTIHNDLTINGDVYNSSPILNFYTDASFESNVYLQQDLFTSNNIYIYPDDSNNSSWWRMFCKPTCNVNEVDLYFVSRNGAAMAISDNFEESIINFTGQHRCSFINSCKNEKYDMTDMIGKIVRSTGEYNDLYDSSIIRINEAVPIVELCTTQHDKAVFGVISGEETDNRSRSFNIGNLRFLLDNKTQVKKVTINSVGEGGIWVCDINGHLRNGDYVTTSIIPGYGVLQKVHEEDIPDSIRRNYTVAKITCDCDFDVNSKIYKCETFYHDNIMYKKAFVGCVYCC